MWTCQTTRALNTNLHTPRCPYTTTDRAVRLGYWKWSVTHTGTRTLMCSRCSHEHIHKYKQIMKTTNNASCLKVSGSWKLHLFTFIRESGIAGISSFIPVKSFDLVKIFRKIYFCQLILIKSLCIFVVFSHLIVWRLNVRILRGFPVAMLLVTIWYLRLPVLLFVAHCLGHM